MQRGWSVWHHGNTNFIEGAFSKVKGLLRKAESRGCEALVGTTGEALGALAADDARAFSAAAATVRWTNRADERSRNRFCS